LPGASPDRGLGRLAEIHAFTLVAELSACGERLSNLIVRLSPCACAMVADIVVGGWLIGRLVARA
jgi:hypothetical protein